MVDFNFIIPPGTKIIYKSPSSKKYTFENGWDELKKATLIDQDKTDYFIIERNKKNPIKLHKSRLVKIINFQPGFQFSLF